MILLWIPMGLLYELGIYLCVWQGGPITFDDLDSAPSEEMVEV
jgi:Sec-independent protein secretion pathway component TatC